MEKMVDLLQVNRSPFNLVSAQTNMRDALYKMYCEHVDHLVVMEGDGFAGILTEHDVASKVLFSNEPLQHLAVEAFMTRDVPVVDENDLLEHCMQVLDHYNAHFLAVYNNFNFRSVVSEQDVMRQTLKKRAAVFANPGA